MFKNTFLACLFLISNFLLSQETPEVTQFNEMLNQFLNVRDFCLSEKEDEAFFTIQSPNQDISQIAFVIKENNTWSSPKLMTFCDSYMYMEPFLSPDQNRLFFVSNRPLDKTSSVKKDYDIWYVIRKDEKSEWSEPINIGAPINSENDEFYPSLSKNNNLYFTMDAKSGYGKDDIYVSQWNGKNYEIPSILGKTINSDGYEFNAFISKNENFILYTKYATPDGLGSGDLYLAHKDQSGNWQKAVNLGLPINTKYMEYCPFYDEKNQTLYFTSKRNDLTPKKFATISDFNQTINQSANGLSKIFQVKLTIK